jgi:ferritin-like metal-binding protein YciE
MPVKNSKEVFILLLSHARQSTERAGFVFRELGEAAQNPEVRDALDAGDIAEKTLATLDEIFRLLGEKPISIGGRLQDVFLEDFRNDLTQIQSPEARRLFILMKADHLLHLHMGEYVSLIAASDVTGKYGLGMLLDGCLADLVAFAERTRRQIRNLTEMKVTTVGSGT